jgi:5-formyltetrahydrofolate cyclo-ligase
MQNHYLICTGEKQMTMDEKLIEELEERLKTAVHLDEPKRTKEFNSILAWLKDETLINSVKTIKKRIDESRKIEVPGMSKDEIIFYSNLFAQRCYKILAFEDYGDYINDDFKDLETEFCSEYPFGLNGIQKDFKQVFIYEKKKKEIDNYELFLDCYKASKRVFLNEIVKGFFKEEPKTYFEKIVSNFTKEKEPTISETKVEEEATNSESKIDEKEEKEEVINPFNDYNFELFKYLDEKITHDIVKTERAKFSYIFQNIKDLQRNITQKNFFEFVAKFKRISIANRIQPSANDGKINVKIEKLINDFKEKNPSNS